MKKFKLILAVALCALFTVNTTVAQNQSLQKAQDELERQLNSLNIRTDFDPSDNSINFKINNILYYVIIKENASGGYVYNLYRKAIKLNEPKVSEEELQQKTDVAILASNMMNTRYDFKTFVDDERVKFVFTIYGSNDSDFTKVLQSGVSIIKNADMYYTGCQAEAQNILSKQIKEVVEIPEETVVEEVVEEDDTPGIYVMGKVLAEKKEDAKKVVTPKIEIKDAKFRIINAKEEVIADYAQPKAASVAEFIQPELTIKSDQTGTVDIAVQIIDPNGQTIVPTQCESYTYIAPVKIEKKNAEITVTLPAYGTTDPSQWIEGGYTIKFYYLGEVKKDVKLTLK